MSIDTLSIITALKHIATVKTITIKDKKDIHLYWLSETEEDAASYRTRTMKNLVTTDYCTN